MLIEKLLNLTKLTVGCLLLMIMLPLIPVIATLVGIVDWITNEKSDIGQY